MTSDLIYREDAKVFVRHACYKKINPIDYLDEVPAADVRPVVRGKWVEDDYGFVRCSTCGMEWEEPEHPKTNYCPNCGADMREVTP